QSAVLLESDFNVRISRRPGACDFKLGVALVEHLDRSSGFLGKPSGSDVPLVGAKFTAEPAAGVTLHHMHVRRPALQVPGYLRAISADVLSGDMSQNALVIRPFHD